MASSNETISMALFCDFENVALGVRDAKYEKFDIKLVLERLLLKGSIVVKKAYCDWERYKSFKGTMHEANFELIEIPHVRQSGKNSADIRLVVDALDLCYTKSHVNTFVIISGDSDFSPLVSKLRENAKQVIGVGVQQSTSDLLIANCDEFIFYDDLVRESQRNVVKREPARPATQQQPAAKRAPDEPKRPKEDLETRKTKAVEIAVQTFDALASERGDSGKIWASVLKNAIKRRKPDFNETYYGFRAFGNLLEEAQARGLLEFGRDEKSGAYVYRSTAVSVSETTSESASEPLEATQENSPSDSAERSEAGGSKQRDSRRRGRGNRSGSREMSEAPQESTREAAAVPVHEDPAPADAPREIPVYGGKVFADEDHEEDQLVFVAEQDDQTALFAAESEAGESVEAQEAESDTADVEPAPAARKTRTSRTGRTSRKTAAKKAQRVAETPAAESTAENVSAQQHEPQAEVTPEAPAPRKTTARKAPARSRRPRKAAAAETE
ncbi:NYN domain-containing protein [Paraburkholderia sp. DHOC27]|uniref:NYN domain-containing protein n=1 Tax=Paraburkholderia sp. DHOC27 TaxID=2303330 RepID=UPI000E3DE5AD|nr:NYN domain-containing protein [Paraburkholderia sp. DHOC27]RFU46386.1 NYN domain-containing protein [Paraburkholderia sp. DHOC27]